MEISRREFLRLLGVTTAGVSLVGVGVGCDSKWSMPDEMYERIAGSPRIETWKTSVCSLCPGACGIKVRLIDGIPIRILGNPIHPVNRGGICPVAEAGIESLFNPDRIKQPLRRVGVRGEDRWESISWEEAIQTIIARLQGLRENGEPHKLAFWSGHENSLLADLLERFMHTYGSPNLSVFGENNLPALATYLTQGHKNALGYDFKNIELVINFGADVLDVGPSPIRFNQLYAELRSREDGKHAKIIHIDSRLSRTAGISHQWLPIRPETMAALALGMANVLIRDGQYDQDFIKTKSFGFDDWKDSKGISHQGFKSLVGQEYPPEKVEEITGVPAPKIVKLARDFGAAKSALVLAGGQATNSSNSLYTLWAIECLNALKGNFKKGSPISFVEAPPFAALPHAKLDAIASAGLRQPGITQSDGVFCFSDESIAHLPNNISDKKPYPIDVLMLSNVNPVFNSTGQSKFIAALKEIPFIVSFSPFVDETSIYADLILPDHSFLEKHEVFYNTSMVEFSHFGTQQPVVEPLFNTRNVGDVILKIMHELGGAPASSFQMSNYQEYIQSRLEGVYQAGTGALFTEQSLKKRGPKMFETSTFKEFRDVLLDKGGWLEPFPKKTEFSRRFKTPSRKYEFYSQTLEEAIKAQNNDALNQKLKNWRVDARGDRVFLPHHETPKHENGNGKFDLHLLTYNLITNSNGMASNLPLMQELFGVLAREYWQSWLEINPETAHEHGLSDGDMVKVTSHEGSLQVKVKILPGIMPDVVFIPFGLGHKAYGRYAKGIGVNPYEILTTEYDYLSGRPSLTSTKVMLEKDYRKENS